MIIHGFVFNPDQYLLPAYKISPFLLDDVARNQGLTASEAIDTYFHLRFPSRRFVYTENGRRAIELALLSLGLQKEDCVTILTTTGNFYISGCVTKEIEKVCHWSRNFEDNTKAIFVNHEFGFCYEDLLKLKTYGLPIIEDCAHSFYSNNADGSAATVGDFVVYSFPKFFPIQIGGLLLFHPDRAISENLPDEMKQYMQKVLSHSCGDLNTYAEKRKENYNYLSERFQSLQLSPRFSLTPNSIPGVFMFNVEDESIDLAEMKTFLWKQGIECSVFYGERAFFLPVHHRLQPGDMDYFFEAVRYFITSSGRIG